jgi:hypothetical protein
MNRMGVILLSVAWTPACLKPCAAWDTCFSKGANTGWLSEMEAECVKLELSVLY